jgi:Tfp pilus assembly protein PilN
MMRRIDLLPDIYARRQRERRVIAGIALGGMVLLLLLLGYWLVLGARLSNAKEDLAASRARNAELQSQIDDLQKYSEMDAEVTAKRAALEAVLAGDVAWPSVLNDVANVLPGEVWLRVMTASAGTTEGATPVGTETAPVRVTDDVAFGRMQFQGSALSQPGVAKWLLSLDTVKEFEVVYLNDATKTEATEAGGQEVVDFDSTLELNAKAAAFHPFLEGLE